MPYVCVLNVKNWSMRRVSLVGLKGLLLQNGANKKKNVQPMGQFSGTHILWTTEVIFFKVGMYGCMYEGHKICEFVRDWLIEIQGVESGELVVPVNNTVVRYMTFLTADRRLCVLMWFMAIFVTISVKTLHVCVFYTVSYKWLYNASDFTYLELLDNEI